MRIDQVVRCRDGTARHVKKLEEIKIPDLYKIGEKIRDHLKGELVNFTPQDANRCIEAFSLCHDMLRHLKRAAKEFK